MSFRLNYSHDTVEELQRIIFVQVWINLVDVRFIKYTCKVGNQTSFTRVKEDDNE